VVFLAGDSESNRHLPSAKAQDRLFAEANRYFALKVSSQEMTVSPAKTLRLCL
jgi:hypothetical protein